MKEYIFEMEDEVSDYAEVFYEWIRNHCNEVIRCKDCKYHGEQYGAYCIKDERFEWYDEDYCSKAERKEE